MRLGKRNPSKFRLKTPLLVWDGECGFCRLCADRIQTLAQGRVELVPYQDLADKFPQAPEMDYDKSVVLFATDGETFTGAGAIYRTYMELGHNWAFQCYSRFKWYAGLSEWCYRLIADNRRLFSRLTKIFWGSNILPDTYRISGWLFGRLLGLITLIAFLSFWSQADGLIGSSGIIPYQDDLDHVERIIQSQPGEISKWSLRPTLLWLFDNGTGMHTLFLIGTLAALLLTIGILPHIAIIVSWACYISLASVAEPFMNFQWDALLLETLFLSLFLVPWSYQDQPKYAPEPYFLGRWLVWLLLFKLMFESGLVKFTYFSADGSNTWSDLTALEYHYWTQPIPSWISWYFHQLPSWIDKVSLVLTYLCELGLPFFIFLPRRFRRLSCLGLIAFQVLIILTGNYGFFNLLTIVLCIMLADDQWFFNLLQDRIGTRTSTSQRSSMNDRARRILAGLAAICFCWTMLIYLDRDWQGSSPPAPSSSAPSVITQSLIQTAQLTRSMNAYGLFRVMTITRPEIIIESRSDNEEWNPILFKYKPVELESPPRFFLPHMPRLDWQCWFEALFIEQLLSNPFALSVYLRFLDVMVRSDLNISQIQLDNFILEKDREVLRTLGRADQQRYIQNLQIHINNYMNRSYWFARFLAAVARSEDSVHDLFSTGGTDSPDQIKVSLYQYSFTNADAGWESGAWWQREPVEEFSFIIDLE